MDTEAFLLRRESIEARMEADRAAAQARPPASGLLWMGLPLVSLAGFLAAQAVDGKKHPVVKGFVSTGVRRLVTRNLSLWTLQKFLQPSSLKRVLSYL